MKDKQGKCGIFKTLNDLNRNVFVYISNSKAAEDFRLVGFNVSKNI